MKQDDLEHTPLRHEADAQLVQTLKTEVLQRSAEEFLHELQVYQIELEMQNEQLRQSQLDLEKSRDRYIDFYNFSPVGYITLNHDGMIDEANLTAAALLGMERGKLTRRRFAFFVAPAERDRWHRHFLSLLKQDHKLSCELLFQHDDGTHFYAHLDCLCLKQDGKEPVVRIVLTDITERKQAEKLLRENMEKWKKLFNLLPVGVSIVNSQHEIFDLNPALQEMLGISKEGLLNGDNHKWKFIRADNTIFPPEEFPSNRAINEQKIITDVEIGIVKESGHVIWTNVSAAPLSYDPSSSSSSVTVTADITGRKQAELKAAALILRNQLLMQSTTEGIHILDEQGNVIEANDAFCRHLGYTQAEILQLSVFDWEAKLTADELRENIKKLLNSHAVFETVHRRKDGALVDVELSVSGVELDGQKCLFTLSRDTTQRKQTERTLLNYANKLALHNRILGLINQDMPLLEILDKLTREAEALHPEIRCSVMLLDKGGKHLNLGAAPSLPDAYKQRIDGLAIDDGKCSCVEAVCSSMNGCCTSVGVEDIQQHGCGLARLVGMQSCRTQSILNSDNRVLGIFTVYYRQPGLPEETVTSLLENYTNLAMLAIERDEARLVLRSEQELKAYQLASRGFSGHLQTMLEEEKARIAREVHDDMGGTLTALKLQAYWLAEELSANNNTAPFLEHTDTMAQLVDEATNAMRRIITGLRPAMLDDLGLLAAIEWHAAQFSKQTGIECRTNCIRDDSYTIKEPDSTHSINLFRIFQEALTNVNKHSRASKVDVELYHSDEEIMLAIKDNGCGIPENHIVPSNSFGLLGMTERVEQLGGKIEYGNQPGGGFGVTVNFRLNGNTNEVSI